MNYSSRFWLFAPISIFLVLAAAAAIHWYVVAGALEKKLDAANGHEVAKGVTLSFAAKKISGFPFNIDIVFERLAVSGDGAHGPFRWSSEHFALHRLTYGRAQDIYEAAGNQTLSWVDGGGRSHSLSFLPATLHASAITDANGLLRFDLEAVDAGGVAGAGEQFTAADAQIHLRRDPKADAIDLQVSGVDIKAQEEIAGLFGKEIKSLKLYLTLTHGSSFAPLLAGTELWPDASDNWHANKGTVMVGPVEIKSSSLNLTANAFSDTGGDLSAALDGLY